MDTPTSPSVLVAVGTSGSYAALDHAADLARHRGTRLHVLHATDPGTRLEGEARLAAAVRRAAERVDGAVPVHGELALAPPLTAVARAGTQAGVVVVGRRAVVRDAHPYVRSVAGGVGSRLTAPVVTVPDGWPVDGDGGARDTVVVGVDEPGRGADVLATALEAARARSVALTVVCCWWRPIGAGRTSLTHVADQVVPPRLHEEVHRALAPLRAAYADVPVRVEVRNARPGEALIEASRTAGLVVLGRHTVLVPVGSHLGPVARAVVREAACPVLLAAPADHHGVEHHGVEHHVPAHHVPAGRVSVPAPGGVPVGG